MADITPVTREEFYLAKAGGQDVPVPSAVTREEYYLEKLSNDNVDVPTPVTRREKFLYFACGGEIDLPSEEKMTRLERLIAKAGGMDVSTPTAVTRLEKFWVNVEGGGWKTITGVLPLTFTAKGGNAADWVIEGNDENGTENLMQIIATSKTQSGIIFTVDGNGRITINGNATANASLYIDWVSDKASAVNVVEPSTTYTVSGGLNTTGVMLYWGTFNSDDTHTQSAVSTSETFTTGATAEKSRAFIFVTSGTVCDNLVCKPMLVKGSIAPDHYIPYQQGVGERTENLFDKTTATQYRMINSSTGEVVSSFSSRCATDWIDIKQSDTISISNISVQSGAFYDSSKQYISGIYSYGANKSVPSGAQYVRLTVLFDDLDYFMLVKGSTVPQTYIPYGYQIPITVSQTGQTDKNYDIYIGDSPLTEGETVSKTSTGVDIELFEGENTVSTMLYNKPDMGIKYK